MSRYLLVFASSFVVLASLLAQSSNEAKSPAKNADLEEAEQLFRQGKVDDAFKKIQEAVKKKPSLPPARLLLARLFLAAKQTQPARTNLEQAITENPEHPEVYLVNAGIAMGDGRIAEIILNCQTALTLAKDERWDAERKLYFQKEARGGLATAYEMRQDWANARKELTLWLELDTKNVQIRQRLARALFAIGKADDAFLELQTAHKEDPTIDPPELALARIATQRDDRKVTEEWFQKAIAKYPKNPKVHQAFGGWLLDTGKIEAAKIHIETAASLEAKSRETIALRGLLARYLRDFPAAEKCFDELYRDNPGDFFSSNQLALVLIELDDSKAQARAIQIAEVNVRQYNRLTEAISTLGWIYFKAGRYDEADRAFGVVTNSGQISADSAYYIAKFLAQKSKFSEAKQILEKALDSSGVFVNRGVAKTFADELKTKESKKE